MQPRNKACLVPGSDLVNCPTDKLVIVSPPRPLGSCFRNFFRMFPSKASGARTKINPVGGQTRRPSVDFSCVNLKSKYKGFEKLILELFYNSLCIYYFL